MAKLSETTAQRLLHWRTYYCTSYSSDIKIKNSHTGEDNNWGGLLSW